MARNERLIPASPERVFAVLADPDSYGHWVVGSDTIRGADDTWPAVGSRFHHRVGRFPLALNDHTEVIAMEPGRRLELHAKARPLGTAHVALDLERRGDATLVTMTEDAGDRITRLVFNPLTHFLVKRRNDESLRRLAELATP
ncbi:SRPBCC family protein [Baekduia alba]|uniref:SRPBCC family protein n=1 Tax=Baekduia alba TaxID=2997333 RepID=UPI002340B1A4|nr:SRPBCC family protein [Baekduia alba]